MCTVRILESIEEILSYPWDGYIFRIKEIVPLYSMVAVYTCIGERLLETVVVRVVGSIVDVFSSKSALDTEHACIHQTRCLRGNAQGKIFDWSILFEE